MDKEITCLKVKHDLPNFFNEIPTKVGKLKCAYVFIQKFHRRKVSFYTMACSNLHAMVTNKNNIFLKRHTKIGMEIKNYASNYCIIVYNIVV